MKLLIDEIRKCIVFERTEDGKMKKKAASSSSIELPVMDEEKTQKNLDELHDMEKRKHGADEFIEELKKAVVELKCRFNQTHDGFAQAAGIPKGQRVTVADMYVHSISISYLMNKLIDKDETICRGHVGIGVMHPAGQDCGKNLIKLMWQGAGYRVTDMGRKAKTEDFMEFMKKENPDAIAVSCMVTKCVDGLRKMLEEMKMEHIQIPVIIGGIAVNKIMARELSKEFGMKVCYGSDVNDAEPVLERALRGEEDVAQNIVELDCVNDSGLRQLSEEYGFKIYPLSISDIVMNEKARQGCEMCNGYKKDLCPLNSGFEQQESLEESIEHARQFSSAILVSAPIIEEQNEMKEAWMNLLRVENYLDVKKGNALALRFPIPCPLCKPDKCTIRKGTCRLPAYYRQVHETLNINVKDTVQKLFGEYVGGRMYAVVLYG